MSPRFNFGVYHWRRRFRRLGSAAALLGLALVLWLRSRRPLARLAAAGLALAGVRRGRPPVRRLLVPPPWRVERYKYDALGERLPYEDADRALDVGSGTGRSLVGLAPSIPDDCTVVGLDVFDARVILGNGPALARRNAARADLDAEVLAGDASRLPFTDDSQDVVTACRVLHDLPKATAEKALVEVHRVCRPDGTLGVLELSSTHGTDADPLDYWPDLIRNAGFEVRDARRVTRDGEETGYVAVVAEPAEGQ